MESLLERIRHLVEQGNVRVSAHGYDELADDDLRVRDVLSGLGHCQVIREYPEYAKGPCILVLFRLEDGTPVHAVWGIPRGKKSPAVLVTSYRPDPAIWEADAKTRRQS